MDKKQAFFSNHFFLIGNNGKFIGVKCGDQCFMLGDRIKVEGDSHGHIAPGITRAGCGTIDDIVENFSDHYFGVRMDNGEYGYIKYPRIAKVLSTGAWPESC